MVESLVNRIESLLTEDMWTRSALSNYTVSQFEELEPFLEEAYRDEQTDEVRELCESLDEGKNSILALYLAGVLAWEEQQLEDADLVMLIQLFSENNKWSIVEYIAKKMLRTGENKTALRALITSYEKQSLDAELYEVIERLARVDYEDAELTARLAQYYEQKDELDEAISYYKKSAYRYINRKQFAGLLTVWEKLMFFCMENNDLFASLISKTEKTMGAERAIELQNQLVPFYKKAEKWDLAITLLKKTLAVNPKEFGARKDLIECYKAKYSAHSRLNECLAISNLEQNWRNVHEAIESFEKQISLDKNRFVFHRTWGVGRIKKISEDNVIINFNGKKEHSMGLEMAVSSLLSLDDNHIWVLKATQKRDKLKEMIKSSPEWALKIIASSFGGQADMKKVKAELSPSDSKNPLLTTSEWSSWSSEARKVLRNNPEFGNNSNKSDIFTLRSTPVSLEEKLANRFKAEENFFKRITILEDFLSSADASNEFFDDMFNYFISYLKAGLVNEYVVSSYLFVQRLVKQSVVTFTMPYAFLDLYKDITEVEHLFSKIQNKELKEEFLGLVLRHVDEWQEVFLNILPQYPNNLIIEELKGVQKTDEIKKALSVILERARTMPEPFFWVAENYFFNEANDYNITQEMVLINLIHLVDITYRNISTRKDLAESKRTNRRALNMLFKDDYVVKFLANTDANMATRIYGLFINIADLDKTYLDQVAVAIKKQHPDLVLTKITIQEKVAPQAKSGRGSTLVTEKSYKAKMAALKNIVEIEIPKNSAEIGEAIKKGDLKENAEYIFGKERQEYLQQEVGRLQKELDNARIFEEDNIDITTISFGTIVKLKRDQKVEEFTILGPWESNPDANTISYLAPFAAEILGKKVGEKFSFTINDELYNYEVLEITATKF